MTIRGREGSVKRGYRAVATLREWTVDAGSLTASASSIDAFQFERGGPFTVALQVGRQVWAWPETDVAVSGETVTAHLAGSPERG